MLPLADLVQAQNKVSSDQLVKDAIRTAKDNRAKKKSQTDPSWMSERMQDLTSRFNRYFNAKLLYEEGVLQLKENTENNYDDLLPVYEFGSGDGTTISSNLDQIIQKTSTAIQLKPFSKWVDDCYLLIGQANYLIGDDEEAIQSFQYISKNFDNNIRKLTVKEEKELLKKEKEEAKQEARKAREESRKEYEQQKKERAKERTQQKKEKAKAKKQREKERAKTQKEKRKAAKERIKEREKEKKAKAKAKKKRAKEKAKAKKKRAKEKAKAKKRRKKGKPVKKSSSSSKSSSKNSKSSTSTTTESKKKEQEVKTKKETNETQKEKKPKEKKQKEEPQEATELTEEADTEEVIAVDSTGYNTAKAEQKSYKNNGMGHQLAKYDASLWLARTYIDAERYADANTVLNTIQEDKNFPKKLNGDLNRLWAHYHFQRKEWPQTKAALRTAIDDTKRRANKARMYFLLAQLEQRDNNYNEAIAAFKKVSQSRAPYEMDFHAQLNIAQVRLQSGEFSSDQAIAYLEKMLNDEKNIDYKDQIYFKMAEVELIDGDIEAANEYLALSAESSTNNADQKAISFLKLADLNFEYERFTMASAYYDSTLSIIDKEFTNYDQIKTRKEVLGDLVLHLNTIQTQDSLLTIANMSGPALNEFLDNYIIELQAEAIRKRMEEEQQFLASLNGDDSNEQTGGVWYFYNEASRSTGFTDFKARWGDRPLVDNWRLQNKISGTANMAAQAIEDTTQTIATDLMALAEMGQLSVEDLKKDLPLSDQAKAAADSLIVEAFYKAGRIYRNDLESFDKAAKTFDQLLNRYPINQYAPQVHYSQYLMAQDAALITKANNHKNTILNDFPETIYAQLLQDANFIDALNEEQRELEVYYEQTYAYYKANNFEQVANRYQEVNTLFEKNHLQAKFDLLNALVIGYTDTKQKYMIALQVVIDQHPDTEESEKAKELLQYAQGGGGFVASKADKAGDTSIYTHDPDGKQYMVVAFDAYTQGITGVTNQVSNFNGGNFSSDKLKVNQMLLDPQNQIVLIKDFPNADKAMIYYRTFQQNEGSVLSNLDVGYKYFIISKRNFTTYFKQKDATTYFQFFLENYQ